MRTRRAHRELSALLDRAPQMVTRYEDGELVVRPIDDVRPGDRLFVKTGEVVPVDGVLMSPGVFDESALTGESAAHRSGRMETRSDRGAVNAGSAVDLRAVSDGSREHVCRHRASGHGGGEAEGAVRAGRGPLCA